MIGQITGQLLSNASLLTALAAMVLVQTFKILYYWVIEHDLNWRHFFEVGGMPSSHAALVVCLSMMLGFTQGFDSGYFSIAAVLSAIVMHDAIKVRPEEVSHTMIQVSTGALFGVFISLISFFIFVK